MNSPFPGMDPYLEHPSLWEGFHSRCIVTIANLLQPALDPRYIASVEERVFIEGPQQRIPDVWNQQARQTAATDAEFKSTTAATAVDYVVCINRWPGRTRFEIYPRRLEQPLPRIAIPLSPPDADAPLDLQLAVERVYDEARYAKRLRYDQPCVPALKPTQQQWAIQLIEASQIP